MPKVTSVEPQKKNPKRFNVFLDGEFAFGADEDLVVSHRLIPGKIITENDLNYLIEEAEVGKLMERMYGLFSIRQRSEKEIRTYLNNLSFKRKLKDEEEVSDITINLLVEKLKQKKLINDLEFARAWVEARIRSRKKGINVLKQELIKKGIDKDIIEEVLEDIPDQQNLAKLSLQKKIKKWRNLPEREFKNKAISYLIRQGFKFSVAKEAVENSLLKE